MRIKNHLGFLTLLFLAGTLVVGHQMGWWSFETIQVQYQQFQDIFSKKPLETAAIFLTIYIFFAALPLPLGAMTTIMGGVMFGTWLGFLLSVIGATTGSYILFLAAKSSFQPILARRFHRVVAQIQSKLQNQSFSFLLFLRFVPIFPFFVVNLASGLVGVGSRTYLATTILGIMPGTLAYSWIGSGLTQTFGHQVLDWNNIDLAPEILMGLFLLGILALIPVFYRRFKKLNEGNHDKK